MTTKTMTCKQCLRDIPTGRPWVREAEGSPGVLCASCAAAPYDSEDQQSRDARYSDEMEALYPPR
ncbi:MAG: hypothetical protein A3E78_09250 [Alphaproteobacteria bacterium RIFCSPHIGHO2_12_FULL_63_12]|nr:MAG: hypothetical protein A3E78_09250 [Alphaproteobacteria bacterium RIFCSPHIGHO2_12_FULL_63_12]